VLLIASRVNKRKRAFLHRLPQFPQQVTGPDNSTSYSRGIHPICADHAQTIAAVRCSAPPPLAKRSIAASVLLRPRAHSRSTSRADRPQPQAPHRPASARQYPDRDKK
jgi:hypothetical protein